MMKTIGIVEVAASQPASEDAADGEDHCYLSVRKLGRQRRQSVKHNSRPSGTRSSHFDARKSLLRSGLSKCLHEFLAVIK